MAIRIVVYHQNIVWLIEIDQIEPSQQKPAQQCAKPSIFSKTFTHFFRWYFLPNSRPIPRHTNPTAKVSWWIWLIVNHSPQTMYCWRLMRKAAMKQRNAYFRRLDVMEEKSTRLSEAASRFQRELFCRFESTTAHCIGRTKIGLRLPTGKPLLDSCTSSVVASSWRKNP